MRDPDTTFDQLKSLRLACKSFDCAAAPRLLYCVRLFGLSEIPMSNIRQLQTIVSPDLESHLCMTKNTTIRGMRTEKGHI